MKKANVVITTKHFVDGSWNFYVDYDGVKYQTDCEELLRVQSEYKEVQTKRTDYPNGNFKITSVYI